MKIQYCSDLHLEFKENKEFLKANPLRPVGDILILAGDIVPFTNVEKHNDFFDYLADNFEATYWVPGNHEYYQGDLEGWSGSFFKNIRNNVHLINNQAVIVKNTRLIFSTLWSQISQANQWIIRKNLNDFHVITNHGAWFMPPHYNELHLACHEFLSSELEKPQPYPTIVVTHHVPTFLNYPERYKGDILNEAFAVELHDMISKHEPEYWIYGHHHHNIPDFNIGKTKLATNQLGYIQYNEKLGFNERRIINIYS